MNFYNSLLINDIQISPELRPEDPFQPLQQSPILSVLIEIRKIPLGLLFRKLTDLLPDTAPPVIDPFKSGLAHHHRHCKKGQIEYRIQKQSAIILRHSGNFGPEIPHDIAMHPVRIFLQQAYLFVVSRTGLHKTTDHFRDLSVGYLRPVAFSVDDSPKISQHAYLSYMHRPDKTRISVSLVTRILKGLLKLAYLRLTSPCLLLRACQIPRQRCKSILMLGQQCLSHLFGQRQLQFHLTLLAPVEGHSHITNKPE